MLPVPTATHLIKNYVYGLCTVYVYIYIYLSADPFLQREGAWEGFVFVLVFVMFIITTDVG